MKLSLTKILKENFERDPKAEVGGDINKYHVWLEKMARKIADNPRGWNTPHLSNNYIKIANKFFDDGMELIKHHYGDDGSIQPSSSKEDINNAVDLLVQEYGKYIK